MALVLILTVNFIASVLFLFKNRKEGAGAFLLFLLFLAVPVFGILLYALPAFSFRVLHKRNVYNSEDLIAAGEDEVYAERPDVREEMNVIPVKEALVVNEAGEKRRFVLNIIKENMAASYKTILPALGDSDSETSHYAAAAALEMQRRLRKEIERLKRELKEQEGASTDEDTGAVAAKASRRPGGASIGKGRQATERESTQKTQKTVRDEPERGEPTVERELLDALKEYMDSGVLTDKDRKLSRRTYIDVMRQGLKKTPEQFDNGYYLCLAQYLMEEEAYDKAVRLIDMRLVVEPSEKLYEKLLEIYYLTGDQESFQNTIERVRGSGVVLSPEALARLRFWMRKEGMS